MVKLAGWTKINGHYLTGEKIRTKFRTSVFEGYFCTYLYSFAHLITVFSQMGDKSGQNIDEKRIFLTLMK